jgi:hypothetical protein
MKLLCKIEGNPEEITIDRRNSNKKILKEASIK